jgi:hypothetical protein
MGTARGQLPPTSGSDGIRRRGIIGAAVVAAGGAITNWGMPRRAEAAPLIPGSEPSTLVTDQIVVGGHGASGVVSTRGTDDVPQIELLARPTESVIGVGNTGRPGRLTMYDGQAKPTVNLSTADATLTLGGAGLSGKVSVRDGTGKPQVEMFGTPTESIIGAGGHGHDGRLTMYTHDDQPVVQLTTATPRLILGGGNRPGSVSVHGKDGAPCIELLARDNECVIGVGQKGRPARISLYDGASPGRETLRLDGSTGDIWLANADCAEDFDVEDDVREGDVVVLSQRGSITVSTRSYDSRVAGVISGAGTLRPALVLDRPAIRSADGRRLPLALVGKVYCRVDASTAPITVGSLLTTSDRPGHAMAATEKTSVFGALLGKALEPLSAGSGLIRVLVTLG